MIFLVIFFPFPFFFFLLGRLITGILEVQVVLASEFKFIDTMMFVWRKAILGHVYDLSELDLGTTL